MSSEPEQLNKSGGKERRPGKIRWLFVAFIPTALGLLCTAIKNQSPVILPILLILNLALSTAAAAGLTGDMKKEAARNFLALFLIFFFFVSNVILVLLVACSGMRF